MLDLHLDSSRCLALSFKPNLHIALLFVPSKFSSVPRMVHDEERFSWAEGVLVLQTWASAGVFHLSL